MVYGERGVGKTSLALMGRDAFRASNSSSVALRLTCTAEDDFESIWKRFPAHLLQELEVVDSETQQALAGPADRIEDLLTLDEPTPDSVARALYLLGNKLTTLVIVDEFDRIGNPYATVAFADLIKNLSDNPAPVTLVLVGVADSVDELVMGHASVDRALGQVQMPRMSSDELREVVVGGLAEFIDRTGWVVTMDDNVITAIVHLSQGFPYYTHLLTGAIIEQALRSGTGHVETSAVYVALLKATDSAVQSIRSAYAEAVTSNQNAGFEDTLLACAMARLDVTGYFKASDVINPRADVTGVRRAQAYFNHHLKKFCEQHPRVLEVKGESRYRYRFADPLMKPFVLMQAVQQGKLDLPS